ncbi:MAG: hypothetical protein P0116_03215 [Candidatus Nitrosocosmicus sp.]|nr:hypothetical protein [Candidatus Nitrosocosmicus sp.]
MLKHLTSGDIIDGEKEFGRGLFIYSDIFRGFEDDDQDTQREGEFE